jgi:hypothetical protein
MICQRMVMMTKTGLSRDWRWGPAISDRRHQQMAELHKDKGEMTTREAGKKGGEHTAETHGHAFYEEIGKKGGEKVKAERGHEFFEEIGKKGGDKVKEERGHEFYEEIGKKGGEKVRELIEEGKKWEEKK